MINIKDSQMVFSHYLTKHDSGIIELILNLKEKAFWVGQSNDSTYLIENKIDMGHLSDVMAVEGYPMEEIIEIPEIESLFDKDNFIRYHQSSSVCKDQHIFLWIPISLLGKQKLQEKHTESQKLKHEKNN